MRKRALLDLLMIADSAFPTGGHGHSGGLEFAIQQGWVDSAATLAAWGRTSLEYSVATLDLRVVAQLYQEPSNVLGRVEALNQAVAAFRSSLLQREAGAQVGRSLLRSAVDAFGNRAGLAAEVLARCRAGEDLVQLPIAWGATCLSLEIDLTSAIQGYLSTVVRQLVQVAVRIMPIGQRQALAVQADLLDFTNRWHRSWTLEANQELQSSAFGLDQACLGHEMLAKRYFRS